MGIVEEQKLEVGQEELMELMEVMEEIEDLEVVAEEEMETVLQEMEGMGLKIHYLILHL